MESFLSSLDGSIAYSGIEEFDEADEIVVGAGPSAATAARAGASLGNLVQPQALGRKGDKANKAGGGKGKLKVAAGGSKKGAGLANTLDQIMQDISDLSSDEEPTTSLIRAHR